MNYRLNSEEHKFSRLSSERLYRIIYEDGSAGGWIGQHATISADARVLEEAEVGGNSIVTKNATVRGYASVNDSFITDEATVTGHAAVYSSRVAGDAIVSERAVIKSSKIEGGLIGGSVLCEGIIVTSGKHTRRIEKVGSARLETPTAPRRYELDKTDKIISVDRHPVFRVVYTDGTRGGYIQSEDNMPQDSSALILDGAICEGYAVLLDGARISDQAVISGQARVSHSRVSDNAQIFDTAVVRNSFISGEAQIGGNSRVDSAIVTDFAIVRDSAQILGDRVTAQGRSKVQDSAQIGPVDEGESVILSGDVIVCGDAVVRSGTYRDGQIEFGTHRKSRAS